MTALISPSALRALVIAVILACTTALTAPVARGSEASSGQRAAGSEVKRSIASQPAACCLLPAAAVLADEFSWHEFVKFWQRQAGSLSGVLGTVLLVGAGAVLLILSKGK